MKTLSAIDNIALLPVTMLKLFLILTLLPILIKEDLEMIYEEYFPIFILLEIIDFLFFRRLERKFLRSKKNKNLKINI